MRRPVPFAIAAATALLLLTACGGDDDDGASASTLPEPTATSEPVTSTTAAVPASTDPVPTTAAPEDVTPTTPAPTEPPPTAAPATTVAPGGDADCLNGEWRADETEMQRVIPAIGVSIPMTLEPGSYWAATIDHGSFVADSVVNITAEIPGSGLTLTASGSYRTEGTYTVDGNTIVADTVVSEGSLGEWSATINGQAVPLPDTGSIVSPPAAGAPDFNGSTFTCDETTLVFNVPGAPIADITYTRVG